ncbi:sulfatase [Oceanicoccus sp. KOV_DT_Chl]|uniref:sulfatase family protein n=1 Tax=Oceanicoccus sp. KOV_DT_Chl TaxID=1904639 RepID=UPI000C7BD512|nr:sulfatase [Oceanicoccus sp. KOV_DT_Chl]
MQTRKAIIAALAGVLAMLSTLSRASEPNVVFILTDDQRADAVGYHEKPLLGIKTPNIDRLAAEGVRFNNMFATTSLCSPSRASFLSGTYTHTHGVRDNFTDYPHQLKSFPLLLQQAGYQTAYIGKWHMGEGDDNPRPGFDYWVTHKGQGKYYDTEFNVNGERKTVAGYYTDRVTDMALDWLANLTSTEAANKKPFAIVIGHKAPHGPFIPEPRYVHLYDNIPYPYPKSGFELEDKPAWIKERLPTWHGIYGPLYGFRKEFPDTRPEAVNDFERFVRSYVATINSVDDSVGRIYAALERSGELDNTIFIFASDNGFLFGEHGMIDKRTMHEASIRVPLVVRYPKKITAGSIIERHVLSLDVAPSVMELTLGVDMDNIQGRSWVPLLSNNKAPWRQAWLYEYNYEKQFPYTPNVRGIRQGDWKYIAYPHGDGGALRHQEELYNLASDPAESQNLAADPASTEKLVKMRLALAKLLRDTGAEPDMMPIDQGIKGELPEESIR